MLETANSATAAVERIKAVRPQWINMVCLIAAPEGLEAFGSACPDIPVYRLCTWLRWHTMLPPMSTIPGTPNATCAFHRSHVHKRSRFFTAAVDERLDDHDYIIPGLGDAGDRLYGTR